MKRPFRPRATRAELREAALHVIARDFPETLEEFRAYGVSLETVGGDTLSTMADADATEAEFLLDDIEAATAWRPSTPSS